MDYYKASFKEKTYNRLPSIKVKGSVLESNKQLGAKTIMVASLIIKLHYPV